MKKLIIAAAVALCMVAIAAAKSYELALSSPTKIGAVELKAGQYTLKVVGDKAVFTAVEDAKQYKTPVKVENSDKKFDTTSVDANKQGNIDVVKEIDLGGTKTKLEFGEE